MKLVAVLLITVLTYVTVSSHMYTHELEIGGFQDVITLLLTSIALNNEDHVKNPLFSSCYNVFYKNYCQKRGDNELIKFTLYNAYGFINDEWIRLGVNRDGFLYQVDIMQEITGDEKEHNEHENIQLCSQVHYNIFVNRDKREESTVPFCDSTGTIQNDNIVQLVKVTLGLENQECPIQMQVITDPKNTLEEYLELDHYKKNDSMDITLILMKGDKQVSMIVLHD